jgi:hypothetical protein
VLKIFPELSIIVIEKLRGGHISGLGEIVKISVSIAKFSVDDEPIVTFIESKGLVGE